MLFVQFKEVGFLFSYDISSYLVSFFIGGNMIFIVDFVVKEKVFCVLDNLNASVEKQGLIKMYINEVCWEIVLYCCNLFLQQVGLNLLISMIVINNMFVKFVLDLKFFLILEGSGCVEVQVLKLLVGLFEKVVLVGELLGV